MLMDVEGVDEPGIFMNATGLVQWRMSTFPWIHALIGPSYDVRWAMFHIAILISMRGLRVSWESVVVLRHGEVPGRVEWVVNMWWSLGVLV